MFLINLVSHTNSTQTQKLRCRGAVCLLISAASHLACLSNASAQTVGNPWAWGHNINGPLGDGTNVNKPTPVRVSNILGVVAIAGGNGHSLGGIARCYMTIR